MIRNFSLTAFCLLLTSVTFAQDSGTKKDEGDKAAKSESGATDEATEILKKADEACKAVKSVKYTASGLGTGINEARVPKTEGTVILSGYKNGRPEKFRYEVKAQRAGSAETIAATIGSDGNEYYAIDPAKKVAYVDIDPAVLGGFQRIGTTVTMVEFVHEAPFSDEINAEKKELKGSTKVGDEDCFEVYVKYSNQGQEANWFFSKKDYLPRRVDRKFTRGEEVGGTQIIVTSLTVDPKSDKDPLKFELPDGYTKSDDFAP